MKKANFPSEHYCKSPKQTLTLGKLIAKTLVPGNFISLKGPIGAGKTVIARGILEGLGYKGTVTSPTFTVINQYESKTAIYHMDFYRIENDEEIYELGLDDLFSNNSIYLAEWCEKISHFMPDRYYEIIIEILPQGDRKITIQEIIHE